MPDAARFHSVHDLLGVAQHSPAGKAGGDHTAAVHARDEGVLRVAAQLKRLGDDRRKIPVLPDVGDAGIGDDRGGEYPVGIAGPQRHDAVGGEEHRCRDVLKLPLLVLPCGAKVAFQMRKALFQLRVAVGRQHLGVGVDIDALALGLLQQALGVVEVVAGDDDERPFLDGQRHFYRLGVAKRAGVGLVQLSHDPVGHDAGVLHQLEELVLVAFLGQRPQRRAEKQVDLAIGIAQHPGVVRVGRHAPQAEQHEGLQALDVRVRLLPQLFHVVVTHRRRSGAGGSKRLLFCLPHLVGELGHRLGVEVDVGDGGEQPFQQQQCLRRLDGLADVQQQGGKADESTGQPVLRVRRLSRFAADARSARAADAVGCLLTLITKHLLVHAKTSFRLMGGVWTKRFVNMQKGPHPRGCGPCRSGKA